MLKNLILLFFVLALSSFGASAQATAQAVDTNCVTYMRKIFYYAEKGAHFTGSLDEYFKKALPDKAGGPGGAFKIKLIIDSVGRLDCMTIENNSTNYTPEEIRGCINGMPEWLPARQNGYAVTFCAIIIVTFDKGNRTVLYKNEYPYRPR
jgi:hypothetical protein